MKKVEAQAIAPERSRLIIEYITQILSDPEKVSSKMIFSSYKIEGQNMNTFDIYVPKREFEKHLNLGITIDHTNVLYEQFLSDILDSFLQHETIGISDFYSIRSYGGNFDGISVVNEIGSKITINMRGISKELSDSYSKRYHEFANSLVNEEKTSNFRK